MTGLRVLVWYGEPHETTGEPVHVLAATERQLATGRLRAIARGVEFAARNLDQARTELRAQAVEAAYTDRLGRNEIARVAGDAMARRLLLQYLAGHDRARQILAALPAEWGRGSGWPWEPQDAGSLSDRVGPLSAGMVYLEVTSAGVVHLNLDSSYCGPDAEERTRILRTAGGPELARRVAQVRAHMNETAREVVAVLDGLGLVGLIGQGRPAAAADLCPAFVPDLASAMVLDPAEEIVRDVGLGCGPTVTIAQAVSIAEVDDGLAVA
ncbi:hypothetical protein [Actinoplanes sp. NPDC026619]|uniref:hypothetical protein n=1 Tax=Actinoplanes sp. NPDC026619 TaxID=3155798 RepID=UPI0033D460D8